MKCPLITTGFFADPKASGMEAIDCFAEKCAWWGLYREAVGKEQGACCIPAIALVLSDIMAKMPTEAQFKR